MFTAMSMSDGAMVKNCARAGRHHLLGDPIPDVCSPFNILHSRVEEMSGVPSPCCMTRRYQD